MAIRIAMAAIAVLLVGGPSYADIRVQVATDGSDRLVLVRAPDPFKQWVEPIYATGGGGPSFVNRRADCETFGSRNLPVARDPEFTTVTMTAQYNMVRLWLGRVCFGESDEMPTDEEGRAWLDEVASIVETPSGKPLLDSDELMAEFLMFGAHTVPADPTAAMTYLLDKARDAPAKWSLHIAFMYQEGIGVPVDSGEAWQWIDSAASDGNGGALALQTQALELGLRGSRDEAAAFRAYESGGFIANFRAGLMLLEGRGMAKDACRARTLLKEAMSHRYYGVPQAKKHLDRIAAEGLCKQ